MRKIIPPKINRRLRGLVLAVLVIMAAGLPGRGFGQPRTEEPAPPLMVACEQAAGRILVLRADRPWRAPEEAIVWSWRAAEAPALAPDEQTWFNHPTDAKPVRDGTHLLVTASGGGVALIRFRDKKIIFYAHPGGNPHSATLLPDGSIVVASSTGNRLTLYPADPQMGRPQADEASTYPLRSAHGVAWDARRQRLWTLGGEALYRYRYERSGDGARLVREATFALPQTPDGEHEMSGGHDLSRDPAGDRYFVTDLDHLWWFVPAREAFVPLEPVHRMEDVKSISRAAPGGAILVMKATESWWSDTVRTLDSARRWRLEGAQFYKVRWWPADVDRPAVLSR